MIKKTLSIIFSLVIFCISCSIPITYAEDTISSFEGNYYYWGDESQLTVASEVLESAKTVCAENGKSYSEHYAIHIDSNISNGVTVFFYSSEPNFTYDENKKMNFSQEMLVHRIIFIPSGTGFKVSLWQFDMESPVGYLLTDESVEFYSISTINQAKLLVTSFQMDNAVSGGGSISVSFDPTLTLDLNKELFSVGPVDTTNLPSNYFTMTIKNNLPYAVNVRMYIVKRGESYSLGDEVYGPTTTGWDNYNWNVKYLYVKNDWVYSPDISTETGKQIVQYKATSWHLVGKGETLQQTFSWAQINIEENVQYDIVVDYAESYDEYYASSVNEDYRECYRNTFSLYKRTVPYDENCDDFGIKPIRNYDDFLTLDNFVAGYIDENGEIKMEESFNTRDDFFNGSKELYSGGEFSLSSLTSSTANVLNFFKYVLEFFPSSIWNAFYFLLAIGVVFGFIRLLKG